MSGNFKKSFVLGLRLGNGRCCWPCELPLGLWKVICKELLGEKNIQIFDLTLLHLGFYSKDVYTRMFVGSLFDAC